LAAIPGSIGLASAQFNADGEVIDFSLEWMNADMRSRVGSPVDEPIALTKLFPVGVTPEWLRTVSALRGTTQIDRRFWSMSSMAHHEHEAYQVDTRWWNDKLIVSVASLVADVPDVGSAMRTAEAMSKLMPALPSAYGVLTEDHWLRFPAESFLTVFDVNEDRFSSMALMDLVQERDAERVRQWLALVPHERPQPLVFRSDHISRVERWLELWMAPLVSAEDARDHSGVDSFFILRDVDERIRLREKNDELLASVNSNLSLMYSALNASREGFAIWKAIRSAENEITSFRLVFINEAGAQATGKMPRQLVGKLIEEMMGDDDNAGLENLFKRALSEHEVQIETVAIDSPQGWVGAYENKVVPFIDDQVVASFRDVSEEKREQDRLHWLAGHDHLTGLPNRRNLENYLQAALSHARVKNHFAAFVFIDIDDFKRVNDKFGHDAGDQLLKDFAKRLGSSLGEEAVVARLAGDEFAILLEDVASRDSLDKILGTVLETMRQPFDCAARSLAITCSAGAALCAGEEPMTEVLRIADKAMYRAKHDGKDRFRIVHI
jgi:diguanylate cyclase (GGDEF)-like protein